MHFVLILAVPVDEGGSVSPNIRLHVPSASLPTTSPGRRAGGSYQLSEEATGIQLDNMEKSDPVAGIKNNF